ncbi:MAG: RT0821/Lpp0805 family surface protein [Burkholderiales bacterium]|nr:RT0821/Lpp0805 family surface protein [Burkholderiales bacterium]
MKLGKAAMLLGALSAACWIGTAAAQNLGFMYDSPATYFNAEDRKLFEEAVRTLLDKGRSGEQKKWKNAASGNGGELTVTDSKRKLEGRACRHLKIANYAYNGLKNTSTLEVCRKPDGTWAIVGT